MDSDSGYQTLLNLNSGTFDELYLAIPPAPAPVNIADLWIGTLADLASLHSQADANTGAEEGLAARVLVNEGDIDNLEAEVVGKQDTLTAQWPVRILNNVISIGFNVWGRCRAG